MKRTIYTIGLIIILLSGNFALFKLYKQAKKEGQRWEYNYHNKQDSVIATYQTLSGDLVYKMNQLRVKTSEIKRESRYKSKEIKDLRANLKDMGIKYRDMVSYYSLKLEGYGSGKEPVHDSLIFVRDTMFVEDTIIIPIDTVYAVCSMINDDLLKANICIYDDTNHYDYRVYPEIIITNELTRQCPGSRIGGFFCEKTFLKFLWAKKDVKTKVVCPQAKCDLKSGIKIINESNKNKR